MRYDKINAIILLIMWIIMVITLYESSIKDKEIQKLQEQIARNNKMINIYQNIIKINNNTTKSVWIKSNDWVNVMVENNNLYINGDDLFYNKTQITTNKYQALITSNISIKNQTNISKPGILELYNNTKEVLV